MIRKDERGDKGTSQKFSPESKIYHNKGHGHFKLFLFGQETKDKHTNALPPGHTRAQHDQEIWLQTYKDLYKATGCDLTCVEKLTKNLPKLDTDQAEQLNMDPSLQELTSAVHQLSPGWAPGTDGLSYEFYTFLGLHRKSPCRSFYTLPNKGDLGLLKNWRPLTLFCTDYNILSKVLFTSVDKIKQSYCVPNRTITHIFLIRDIIGFSGKNKQNVDLLPIDQ